MPLPEGALPLGPRDYVSVVAITPTNDVTFAPVKALWVGVGGNLVGQTSDGSAVILAGIPNGTLIEGVRIDGVAATGTTCSNILAFY